ncbi:MAG: TetR/AcrR family transcriptional regulator [Labilithrix sp.]|nr:TetR/AcrR family transcriptional regulator [Labilithrix sp.]MCW5814133.1 TetR/AcrR family transcriptional regulator [Labilithrix sp.]
MTSPAAPRKGKSAAPRKRAEMRAETRAAVKQAAFELFATQGFDETTTQAVAERAEVAAGTVFVHAKDKVDLLSLVMHDLLAEVLAERLATLPEGPLLERYLHVFRGIFAMYARHPKLAAAFVRTLPAARGPNTDQVNALTFDFLHRLAVLFTEAQQKGEVAANLNPIVCVQNVFGLYLMVLMTWLSGHVPIEALDAFLRASLEVQFRGFRP